MTKSAVGSLSGRRLALSPSRASDFRQCPLLYRLRAIDRIPQPPTLAMVRGTLVHAALEELLALPAESRTLDTAAELIAPSWQRVSGEMPEDNRLDLDEHGLSQLFEQSKTLLAAYFALEDPARVTPSACELRVEVDLEPDVPLRGFVDRVDELADGELRVVDYKTGRAPAGLYEAKALFQMKFYALALWKLRGIVPHELRLMYLGSGDTLTYEPDRGELERFSRTLVAIWRAIQTAGRTGDFRPNPGPLCKWCEHQSRCPAFGNTPPEYPGWPDEDSDESLVPELLAE
jgi:putative RecB family exonuclease